MTRAGAFTNRNGHATDRTSARDQHVFADQIERERRVHRVAQRVETGKHIQRDRWVGMPAVLLRNRDELRPSAGTVNADTLRVWTQMPPSSEAIPTMPTSDVPFGNDEIALAKTFDVVPHAIHNADKLMANDHRHRN